MVRFHEHIISDLLEDPNGGLVILSSGLSLHSLISSLLQLHSPSQGTLLILSASPSQKSCILRSLSLINHNPNSNPNDPETNNIDPNSSNTHWNPHPNDPSSSNDTIYPSEISADLLPHQRHVLYSSGSIFFVTSRILIVDLLTSKLPPSCLAGLIILNAHTLSDSSTEAFAVRILRSHRSPAYVHAFSDRPQAMLSSFAKAERILKCLFLRRLHLWPRFHVLISEELERTPPDVVDLRVPLSPLMKGIQKAVVEAMDACLKELRKTNKVDIEDLTLENGLFKSFDEIVRRQLDPIWHTLGKKTKQLVFDLKTLRKLLDYLVRYDAVTYLKYLDTLRVSEGVHSVWIFADSSHKIFEYAKKRIYRLVTSEGGKLELDSKSRASKRRKVKELIKNKKEVGNGKLDTETSYGVVLEEVLEEAPKWKVLRVRSTGRDRGGKAEASRVN